MLSERYCNRHMLAACAPHYPSWPTFPISPSYPLPQVQDWPSSYLIVGVAGWLTLVWKSSGSIVAHRPGVVFGSNWPWPQPSDHPDTICCSSVIIIFRCCAHLAGPPPTTLHCSCPTSASPPCWHQKRESRNKSILVCLIPTDNKNNINSNDKYLVIAY